jgi:hypothetical protein
MPQPDFGSPLAPSMAPIPSVMDTASLPVKRKGGMFGGVSIDPAAGIAGFLAGLGNPAGLATLQSIHQQRLYQQQQAAEDARAEANRAGTLRDQIALFDYKSSHPDPTAAGSMDALRAEYLNPTTSPERKAQLEPLILQPQLQMVPGVGLVSVPRTGAAPAPKPLTDDDILKMGGQSGSSSTGGFSY